MYAFGVGIASSLSICTFVGSLSQIPLSRCRACDGQIQLKIGGYFRETVHLSTRDVSTSPVPGCKKPLNVTRKKGINKKILIIFISKTFLSD
jgi:hypothetical protein